MRFAHYTGTDLVSDQEHSPVKIDQRYRSITGEAFKVALHIRLMTPALLVSLKALVFSANTFDRSDQWRKVHENAAP